MQRKKKRPDSIPGFQIGTSYLLVIFIILCLVTFAALSLSSALRDQSYSQKLAAHQTEYTAASAQASALLAQIDEALEADTPETALEALAGTVPSSDSGDAAGSDPGNGSASDSEKASGSGTASEENGNQTVTISVRKQTEEGNVFLIDALIPVNDNQNLQITVAADTVAHTRQITGWKEIAGSGWEEKTTLPVLGSDHTAND